MDLRQNTHLFRALSKAEMHEKDSAFLQEILNIKIV